jgi:acetylornithine deacetylase/succinyl-diaminopimelate desuccinylase-like protein
VIYSRRFTIDDAATMGEFGMNTHLRHRLAAAIALAAAFAIAGRAAAPAPPAAPARAMAPAPPAVSAMAMAPAPPAAPGAAAPPPTAAVVRDNVWAYRAAHEKAIVGELVWLLARRNFARERVDILANADALVGMMQRRGITTRRLEAAGGSPPAIYGELPAAGAKRTVMFYAHYDGQPALAADWHGDPWHPVVRSGPLPEGKEVDLDSATAPLPPEWRVFARSASDDKAPIVAMLTALDALRESGIQPSVNIKFLFEGEEEIGSPHLAEILTRNRALFAADAWILADGPVHQSRQFQVVFGARGVVGVEITTYGPSRALHSGHYGNWAPNPAALLAQLLTTLRGPDGEARVPGFAEDVRPLTAAERQAAAALPPIEDDLRQELALGWSEGKGERLEELLMRPAINVQGLRAGDVGEAARNAIPTEASASLDFRLVPDQTPERVRAEVERYLEQSGYFVVHDAPDAATRRAHPKVVHLVWGHGYPGARTAMDLPASRAVVQAVEDGLGAKVLQLPMLGGSIPIYTFGDIMKVPVILVPTVNYDNNQHGPDENLRLQNLWDGIQIFASLFARLDPDWQ